jgi:hypothetical protein
MKQGLRDGISLWKPQSRDNRRGRLSVTIGKDLYRSERIYSDDKGVAKSGERGGGRGEMDDL